MKHQRGATMVEFAITWPIVLVTTLGAVQVTLWATAVSVARTAALAGARAGATAGGTPAGAYTVAREVLQPALPGTDVREWCPPGTPPAGVWICAEDSAAAFAVNIGGTVAAVVPLAPGRGGLELHARASQPHERFQ